MSTNKTNKTRKETKKDFSDYISVAEAAKQYGVVRSTVWAWIKAGKLPAVRVGRNYRIKESDLQRVIVREGSAEVSA